MTNRHEYIQNLKDKLDEWDADIDEFEERTQRAKADLKFELEDQLAALKTRRDVARQKLAEIMDGSEEAWQDIKQGVDEAWASMKEAIDKARSHF